MTAAFKKLISAIIIFATVFSVLCAFPASALDGDVLNIVIDSTETYPGGTVDVKINLVNNYSVSSLKLKVSFGSALTLKNIVFDIVDPEDDSVITSTSGTYESPETLLWVSTFGEVTGDTTFATLTFDVSADASGDYAITATADPDDIYDYYLDNVDFVIVPGKVTVSGADLKISTINLALQDNLALNYMVDKSLFSNKYSNPYVVFTMGDIERTVTQYQISGNYYVFTFNNISPHYMNEYITSQLCAEGAGGKLYKGAPKKYKIVKYCTALLSMYPAETNPELNKLIVDMLNYGSKAQIFRSYNTDSLAIDQLTETQRSYGSSGAPELHSVTGIASDVSEPLVKWKNASLSLAQSVIINLVIQTDDITGVKLKANCPSQNLSWTQYSQYFTDNGDGTYTVSVNKLNAAQMCETVEFAFFRGDQQISRTLSYSIESYAYAVKDSDNTALKELTAAMINYGRSAYSYKNK